MSEQTYNHDQIADLRSKGWTWADIAVAHYPGRTSTQLRQAHWSYNQTAKEGSAPEGRPAPGPGELRREAEIRLYDIRSQEDLVRAFDLDPEEWEIVEFFVSGGGSVWDQSVEKGTVAKSERVKVSAHLRRRMEVRVAVARDAWEAVLEDIRAASPVREPLTRPARVSELEEEPMLAVLALMDPHFAMLAWGKETGEDYDLKIAQTSYLDVARRGLDVAGAYDLDRILYLVGNDLGHVDGMGIDAKGNRRGGATTKGTTQDVDSRLGKLYTAIRRATVEVADYASQLAPVDLLVVPGNHDGETMYHMGETLAAWYRNDPNVNVIYSPMKRKYYGWERCALMFTHGEELRRKRDNLAMIMATECPAPIWTASEGGAREIITGHNHVNLQGGYYPTAEADESRQIRTRSLPGLTPEDAWHFEEGYKHRRAGTLLMYRPSGFAGLHEFNV